jgi:branched-chain amino acid transport system permease protein
VRAVADVTLSLEGGRVVALIGPNGAGKTTLVHLMTGVLRPDRGEVCYRGRSIAHLRPWNVARLGIGRLFQDVRLFGRLTVIENLLATSCRNDTPVAGVFARQRLRREERDDRVRALEWLEVVGLSEYPNVAAAQLSYGQQKLLGIARLLTGGADTLLLDEPTAGVNPLLVETLLVLIRELATRGKTVLVIEHAMNVVQAVADWVYFMDEGLVTASGRPEEVLQDARVRARYLGL